METKILHIFLLLLYFSISGEFNIKRCLENKASQISLVIQGKGKIKYIYANEPSEVSVNGKVQTKCKMTCNLPKETNEIVLVFNNQIKSCAKMFYKLTAITKIDLSKFDFSLVTSANRMFTGCENLESIVFGKINTKSLVDMQYIFYNCSKLASIDLSKFDTSKVINFQYMFYQCSSLKKLDLSKFNTKNVGNMNYMFYNCSKLVSINLSKFNTSNVKNMSHIFYLCSGLKSLSISNFDTKNVERMDYMFGGCSSLTSINLSKFKTSKVIYMNHMFYNCIKLGSLNILNFETVNVERMDYMFFKCSKLTSLNLTNFITTKVINMNYMFYNCSKLNFLDLSNFDISEVTSIKYMFYNCSSLIYLNLYLFKYHSSLKKDKLFTGTASDLKYCIKDTKTISKLLGNKMLSNCCDICFGENIGINKKRECSIPKKGYTNNFCTIESTIPAQNNNDQNKEKEEDEEEEEDDEKKCLESNDDMCLKNMPDGYYFDNGYYKKCYKGCKTCEGPEDDNNHNCIECKSGFISLNGPKYINNCYKKCQYYYYLENGEEYTCTYIAECPNDYNMLVIERNECIENCEKDDKYKYVYNNTCYEKCPSGTLNQANDYICKSIDNYDVNELKQIIIAEKDKKIENLQEDITNGKMDYIFSNNSESKEDFVKTEDDTVYQIETSGIKNNNSSNNISSLDLGDCEDTLRRVYNINETYPLIIFKFDYYSTDTLIPIIGYEIYHPLNKSKLDLKYCEETLIKLNIPVSIDENKLFKYDPNSSYYTDNCFSHTTENGTDIILSDRKKEYSDNKNKLILCEDNCIYIGYNATTKQSICNCNVKNKLDLISEIEDNENKISNKLNYDDSSTSSNIVSLKCAKTLFTKDGLKNNISSYVILLIIFYFISSILFYIKCGYPLLNEDINEILKSKNNENNHNIITKRGKRKKKKTKKGFKAKTKNFPPKKYSLKLINNTNINNINQTSIKNNIIRPKTKNILTKNTENSTNKNIKIIYNDFELNLINYKTALSYDKRTCIQYYFSLIRKKHPILFAFCPIKDYNSIIIKSSMFFLIFAIYYAINFSFFNEDIIHQIYENNGKYDFIYFMPKIMISFIISHAISIIIKFIFLSERNLMDIKNQTTLEAANDIASKARRNIIIKYIIYFISGIIFLIFFWLLISSFEAVYQNTKIKKKKNTLICFGISLFYPFIINIFPSIFRILALGSESKNMECIYIFSYILQFI